MIVAPLIGFPGRQLTNTTIIENLQNAEIQCKTLLAIEKEFDPDVIFYFMDLSVEAEALGLKVEFFEEESPNVVEHPVTNEEALQKLKDLNLAEIFQQSRMRLFVEVLKKFKEKSQKPLGCYVIGPFSLSALLMDANNAAMNVMLNPKFLKETLDFSTELIKIYVQKLYKNGADYIIILEPTAVILSPNQFADFSGIHIENIAATVNKPVVLHICGNTEHLFEQFKSMEHIWGLSLDSDINLDSAAQITNKTVIGNLNPVMIAHSDAQQIRQEVETLKRKMSSSTNFILSTGCDLPPETPIDNIRVLMEVARGN